MTERTLAYMPLDELVPADVNPKRHDLTALQASMKRFGYTEPIILDERTGKLVAGHGRVEATAALRDSGAEPPDGVRVDGAQWLVPVVTWESANDDEAAAYIIAANRITEIGGWHNPDLAPMLATIQASDLGLDGVGYSGDDVALLLSITGELGRQAGSFLDDIAASGSTSNPMKSRDGTGITGNDGVDLRLVMNVSDRDEAVLLLRGAQKILGTDSLASTFLAIMRAWQPPT